MGWHPIAWRRAWPRLTRAQTQRLDALTEPGGAAKVYAVPDGSVIVFVNTPEGDLRWIEVVEPEPTFRVAYDTGAGG